jgi:uncharacterized protein YggE
VLKAIEDIGIPAKDVQTSGFSVSPRYEQRREKGPPVLVGYEVINRVRIILRDLSQVGRVLDEMVRQGANTAAGIDFSLSEPRPVLDRARLAALDDARHRAKLYADAAGVKLGRVLLLQEATPAVPMPKQFGVMREAIAASVPVAPGEEEFHVSITVTYALD